MSGSVKTVRFLSKYDSSRSLKYRGVPASDAEKIYKSHSQGNRGPVSFKTRWGTVSVQVHEFVSVEIW